MHYTRGHNHYEIFSLSPLPPSPSLALSLPLHYLYNLFISFRRNVVTYISWSCQFSCNDE